MNLSAQQQAAVERTGQDVCVVAGPGSGKTRVLVERFRWLVEIQGVSPLRILAITFTEKAAHEIKARLVKEFQSDDELRRQIERAYVSTLHGFCMRLLREFSIAAGIDPRFDILDERDSGAALQQCAAKALDDLFVRRAGDFRALLSVWKTTDPAADLIRVYEMIRVSGDSPDSLAASVSPSGAVDRLLHSVRDMRSDSPRPSTEAQRKRLAQLDDWLQSAAALASPPFSESHLAILGEFKCDKRGFKEGHPVYDRLDDVRKVLIPAARGELLGRIYAPHRQTIVDTLRHFHQLYSDYKRAASVLDFSDLEERAIALLRRDDDIRERVRDTFEAVLMDELQDTNPLQWQLMDLIRRPNRFFAVGDINQSIFGFRYAEPRVFRSFRAGIEKSGGKVDLLSRNHRSRAEILGAVDAVTGSLDGIEPHCLEAVRDFAPPPDGCVEVFAAAGADTAASARLEALWVARRIREIEGSLPVADKTAERPGATRPARFSDIAVLLRNSTAADDLEQAFREFDIPFLMNRGRKFFEELEVTDLVAWLRVLANPRDDVALAAVLRGPFFGISDETLLRLKADPKLPLSEGVRAFDASAAGSWNGADAGRLVDFRALLHELRALRDEVSPDRLLARAIDRCGYEAGILPRERANIDKFLLLLRTWHTRRPRSLPDLLDLLDGLRSAEAEPGAPANDTPDAVQVLTIHASKGLEFPVVFVSALHLGVRTDKPSLTYSTPAGLGVLWRDPDGGGSAADSSHQAAWSYTQQREHEETDRLLYVAMTRAEERLVLSYAEREHSAGRWPGLVSQALPGLVRRVDSPPADGVPRPASSAVREPEPLPPPLVEGQFDSTASVTAIAQFQACPRQYYLQRYLGWHPGDVSGAGFLFGSPDEEAAPDLSGELTPTELGSAVHALLAGAPGTFPPEAHELAARFLRSDLGLRAARATRCEREFDFVFAVDGIVLRGQMDLWFEEGGETVLVDYKTDRDEASTLGHYMVQLQLYALALQRFGGRLPDQAWLYFLRTDRAVAVDLSPAALAAARALVTRFREAQDALAFPLNEGRHCYHCGFHHGLCPR